MNWVEEHLFLISILFVAIIPAVYRMYREGVFSSSKNGWFGNNTERTVGEMELFRGGGSFLRLTVHALDRSQPGMDVGVDIVAKRWGEPTVAAPLALSAAEARRLARLLRTAVNY